MLKVIGGVWVDATLVMTAPFSLITDIQENENTDGFMYYLDGYLFILIEINNFKLEYDTQIQSF